MGLTILRSPSQEGSPNTLVPRARLAASEFEYRFRSWIMAAIFVLAYACYNLDHANVVAAIVPRNKEVPHGDLPAHLIYAAAALRSGADTTFLRRAEAH